MKPEIAELKNVAILANQRQHRNTCIEVETYPNHTIKLAFNRETSDYANSIVDFIAKFDPHTVLKIFSALETSEGVQKDMMESMGHMQDEVASQAKIINSLNAIIDGHEETIKDYDELEADRDEWKRVAENNTMGMKGQKTIIDRLKKEIELYGN